MRSLGSSGVWELFVPDAAGRRPLQVPDPRRRRAVAGQGRPDGGVRRGAAGHRVGGAPTRRTRGRDDDWLDRRARAAAAPGADERLRGAPRLVAARPGLPGAGRAAHRVRHRAGLHARGVPAGDGAPVRRFLGLPGHRLLRADVPLRRPGRVPAPGRPAARRRHRGDPGLGARALPQGRVGAGPLRRHPALRAPRPAPGRAPRLGHVRLRLRPPRGAQLPGRQRALLVRRVPRRRAAGRRRRLDALPGLLPQRRRSGRPTSTAAGRTWRRSRSCRRSTRPSTSTTPAW